jgi:hypothetical protein
MYSQLIAEGGLQSPRLFDCIDDARNFYIASQPPGFPSKELPRLEWRHVALHRVTAAWILFWIFIAPLAVTGCFIGPFWYRAMLQDIIECAAWSALGFFVFYVLAILSMLLQSLIFPPVFRRLICPWLGVPFRAQESTLPIEANHENPGETADKHEQQD